MPAQEEMISKARVEEIVRERLARDRQVRAKPEPTAAQPKKDDQKPAPEQDDTRSMLEFLLALGELEWMPSKEDKELLKGVMLAQGREAMDRFAARLKPPAAAAPIVPAAGAAPAAGTPPAPAPGQPNYRSPGAPAGAPADTYERDATKWSKDRIVQLQSEVGTSGKSRFREELDRYRDSLPGGGNGLFWRHIPKVS